MITKSRKRRALEALDKIEGHAQILRAKITDQRASATVLADIDEQMKMLLAEVENAHAPIREAIWRTQTKGN